ncbi:hypothetical protein G4Y79_15250 [Phototrophicus methaneseepsis]|uniref:Uncharacterized protein n=1 Tax=Phototrophicus methaneseepsis TaxID=2710758 RepID=A0A7S8ID70_9CHLR|nr:hypothetical protein [Phototrophicus methaneseepsis]QPC81059.1 hypothetical protein G4Y79_15250 [Phototrophicus methaneseepsis]
MDVTAAVLRRIENSLHSLMVEHMHDTAVADQLAYVIEQDCNTIIVRLPDADSSPAQISTETSAPIEDERPDDAEPGEQINRGTLNGSTLTGAVLPPVDE